MRLLHPRPLPAESDRGGGGDEEGMMVAEKEEEEKALMACCRGTDVHSKISLLNITDCLWFKNTLRLDTGCISSKINRLTAGQK